MRRVLASCIAVLLLATAARGQVQLLEEAFDYDEEHPAAGLWVGNLQLSDQWRYGIFQIDRDEDGTWSVESTVAIVLALGVKTADVTVNDRTVSFSVSGQRDEIRLDGTVSENGQRLAGTVTAKRPGGEGEDDSTSGPFELARVVPVMDLRAPMAFAGQIQVQGVIKLGMTIALAETASGNWIGHVDIPAQMTRGFVLADVNGDGRAFTGVLPGPVPAHLDFEIDESKRRLTGTMKQGPYTLPLDFERNDGYVGSKLARPQHPEPPYPYQVEEVSIEHPDGHVLAGSLTIPAQDEGAGPCPAAILVSGSGPQDRDESLLGHKPFLVIADHLTRHGIAVLRYDDRGFGRSTGDFGSATSADFATDAVAAVRFLRTRNEIDDARIGIVGHSEGGLIAPMVAARDPKLAFIVLLAGPGVTGEEILLLQSEKILRAEGAGDETVATNRVVQNRIFALLRSEQSDEAIKESMRPLLEAAASEMELPDGEVDLGAAIDAQVEQLTSPWMRYFLKHDPRPVLAKVRCPILALNGTLDLQVWHDQNLDEIDRVVREAGGDVTIRRYERLNHLFQPATTGSVSEYAEIEITFDERVLDEMAGWIRERVGSGVSETKGGRH